LQTSLLFYPPSGIGIDWLAGEIVCEFEHGRYCHVACRISETEIIEAIALGVRLRQYEPLGRDRYAVQVAHALNADGTPQMRSFFAGATVDSVQVTY
jgi:hypothetical protein